MWKVKVGVVLGGLLALLAVMPVYAASPLTFQVATPQMFRHVLELDDWLLLTPVYLIPTTQAGFVDSPFAVNTTGGALDDPIVLTNRVVVTGAASDFAVVADGTTTITSSCTLAGDGQTMDCAGTGLGNGAHTLAVTYRSGWNAYDEDSVLFQLRDVAAVKATGTSGMGGCGLVGIYLTKAQVTASLMAWAGGTVNLRAIASPTLWATPYSITKTVFTWHSDLTMAATQTTLAASLTTMLRNIESNSSCDVDKGTYVATTGITPAGAVIALEGFSQIVNAVPNAFQQSLQYPQTAVTPQAFSQAANIDTAAAGTIVKTSVDAIGSKAGVGITYLLALVALVAIFLKVHSTLWAFLGGYCVILMGKFFFGADLPTALVFLPIALIFGMALWNFIADRIFARS
jgi:hypothetical protein